MVREVRKENGTAADVESCTGLQRRQPLPQSRESRGNTRSGYVMARMHELPIEDPATRNGKLRIDGRVVRDDYLFEVKKPSEAKSDWDLYKLVRVIPGIEATRPLDKVRCPLVKQDLLHLGNYADGESR